MGLTNLSLIFDNQQAVYFSGQTVSGRLIVNLNQPKKLRNISVKFKGEAFCCWTETYTQHVGKQRKRRTVTYIGQETYFEVILLMLGGARDTKVLQPGEHTYIFSMLLPSNLPSSFEGSKGHIRYTVKGTIDRPWKFNHDVIAAFTVVSQVDLNFSPLLRNPLMMENTKHFCCFCCKSGPLSLITHIPAGGYVPGQAIPITVEVDNTSDVEINYVLCELQKIVTYHSKTKSLEECLTVAQIKFPERVEKKRHRTWTEQLRIPPLPPSIFQECGVITLDYKIKVKAVPKGVHKNLENLLSIVIGTVPLWQNTAPSQMHMLNPSAPPLDMAASASNLLPPSYEECMFGTTNIGDSDDKYTYGTMSYNPRYPTYSLR